MSGKAGGMQQLKAAPKDGATTPEDEVHHPQAAFASMLEHTFPRAVPENIFIEHASAVLNRHGFTPDTSINLVSTCRDELCRPFTEQLDAKWGDYFNIASLAGFVFCGRTGFKAAMAHSPVVDGKERYVFWVAPHIALDEQGCVGQCMRHGRELPSSACGALMAVQNEIKSGRVSLKLEQTDMEQSLVKQELISHLPYGLVPDLVQLTYAAYECIQDQVRATATASVDPNMCEYAIVAGVQVHGPKGQNYFWPGALTHFKKGQEIDLYEDYAKDIASWHTELKGWSENESLALLQKRSRQARLDVMEGKLDAVRHAGVDLAKVTDNHSRTLLHVAAMHGQNSIVAYLLTLPGCRALASKQDIEYMAPIDYAVEKANWETAALLKAAGGGLEGAMLLSFLVAAVEAQDLDQFGRLVEFAKNREEALGATDRDGRSLVHLAIAIKEQQIEKCKKETELINSLMALGAALPSTDFFGKSTTHGSAALSEALSSASERP